jgi:hypothetical protein
LAPDGVGGAYVAWGDDRYANQSGYPDFHVLFVNHFDGAGNLEPTWPADGLQLDTTSALHGFSSQFPPAMVPDGVGGAFIVWSELRDGYSVRIQHLGLHGVVRWPVGGIKVAGPVFAWPFLDACSDESGGVVVVWTDSRNSATKPDLYAQRVDSTGAMLWTLVGVPISLAPGQQGQPSITASGNGGGIVGWPDDRGGDWDVYAQNINGDGSLGGTIVDVLVSLVAASAGPDGVSLEWQLGAGVSSRVTLERSESGAWSPVAELLGDGAGLVTYTDHSAQPGHRYGYRLRFASNAGTAVTASTWVDVPLEASLSLAGAWPNPATSGAVIAFSLPTAAPARLELYDLGGRRVLAHEVGGAPGSYRVRVASAGQLEPGLYWIVLRQGESRLTRRFAVMK